MKICGVICELNPFTLGHEYLLRTARSLTGADYIIALMSGDFVQRGLPAICDKYTRCAMALKGGADLVIELPAIYATASADYFAYGGVTLLDSLGCVDFLVFGSESGDIELLRSCAGVGPVSAPGVHIMSQGQNSSDTISIKISKLLREGVSYAKAYSMVTGNEFASNDMLGIRYLKSLDMRMSGIKAYAVKREGSDYLDEGLNSKSAGAVRKRVLEGSDYAHLVPKYAYKDMEKARSVAFPLKPGDFSVQLYSVLDTIIENEETGGPLLTDYMDVSANISGRIKSRLADFNDYESFAGQVHSKEYTRSRVNRALLHILLGIRKSDYPGSLEDCEAGYARILGFREESKEVLSTLKESSLIPIISKAGDGERYLDEDTFRMFYRDIHAANIYDRACAFKFGKPPVHDFSRQLVII